MYIITLFTQISARVLNKFFTPKGSFYSRAVLIKAGKNTMMFSWNKITFTSSTPVWCYPLFQRYYIFCSFHHVFFYTWNSKAPSQCTSKGKHSTSFTSCWWAIKFLEVDVKHKNKVGKSKQTMTKSLEFQRKNMCHLTEYTLSAPPFPMKWLRMQFIKVYYKGL